jgi:hypothetical protein
MDFESLQREGIYSKEWKGEKGNRGKRKLATG